MPKTFRNIGARDAHLSHTASETNSSDPHDTSLNLSARGAHPYTTRNDAYNPHSPSPSATYSTPQLTRQAMDTRRSFGFGGNEQEIEEWNEEQWSDYSRLEQEWRRQSEQLQPVHARRRDLNVDWRG
jgi:hypothetical protein